MGNQNCSYTHCTSNSDCCYPYTCVNSACISGLQPEIIQDTNLAFIFDQAAYTFKIADGYFDNLSLL